MRAATLTPATPGAIFAAWDAPALLLVRYLVARALEGVFVMGNRFGFLVLVALSSTACGGGETPTNATGSGGGKTTAPGTGGSTSSSGGSGGSVANGGSGGGFGGTDSPPVTTCDLNTGYPGDEFCILPPPPDQGFQVHIGPSDYDNPGPEFLLQPGDEMVTTFNVTSPNDQETFFYYRQYRMRPTAHHVILSASNGSTFGAGRRIGTANTSQDFPADGVIAPEDQGVGLPLAAHSPISVDFHAINVGEEPALREVWVNFWYRDPSEVTEVANEWFKTGSTTFAIQPYESTTLGPYTCTVQGDGRMLWLYGHRHANNVRFTVTRVRGTQRDVIYDAYDWEEPLLLEYSSRVQNPAPDYAQHIEGGWSGILDLRTGDQIEWQCDVVNTQNATLRFTNQTYLGEMCIVDAEAVGSTCTGGGF
jgi:hypothetical protein